MDSITPGAGKDPDELARRIERIELALSPYQEIDADVRLAGRMTSGRMLFQEYGAADDDSLSLPFACTYNATAGTISVLGGYYQEGATGDWVAIAATAATIGTHVYLVIEQDAANVIIGVTIEVVSEAKAEVLELSVTAPYPVEKANVLIAEIIDDRVVQRRHGNFTLGIWQIEGSVTRWPETLVGSVPPPPAP